jgi:Kef-type K+ transport system membrane component KefB
MNILSQTIVPTLMLFSTVLTLQVLSAGLAARFTGGYKNHESVLIGLGMLGRAELAFIVINIAYVQTQIIDIEQFYILICTAFLLNISVPLLIGWWTPYYQAKKQLKIFGVLLSKPDQRKVAREE